MPKIRVLIADDHAVLRAGLRLLINAQPDMEVVGEAADGPEALDKARASSPDVVSLDLSMPGGGGLSILAQLRQECPGARVLVLTMHSDSAYLREALAAGCSGFVVKAAADTELLTGIRAVHQGRTFVDLHLGDGAAPPDLGLRGTLPRPEPDGRLAELSPRERTVLGLLARGHSSQQVADQLYLSVKTIETYRARVASKLGLRGRAELVRFALEAGLLGPETPDSDGSPHSPP
jgi:DNA-binding NarL/FixJ family response regulator